MEKNLEKNYVIRILTITQTILTNMTIKFISDEYLALKKIQETHILIIVVGAVSHESNK